MQSEKRGANPPGAMSLFIQLEPRASFGGAHEKTAHKAVLKPKTLKSGVSESLYLSFQFTSLFFSCAPRKGARILDHIKQNSLTHAFC